MQKRKTFICILLNLIRFSFCALFCILIISGLYMYLAEGSGSVGKVLDWGSKDCQFETHRSHCVVSLSKTLYPLPTTGPTEEDRKLSRHD